LQKTLASLGIVKGHSIALNSAATECRHVCEVAAIQGVTAAYLTHCWKSFIEYFHDQDWGDGGMTEWCSDSFS